MLVVVFVSFCFGGLLLLLVFVVCFGILCFWLCVLCIFLCLLVFRWLLFVCGCWDVWLCIGLGIG